MCAVEGASRLAGAGEPDFMFVVWEENFAGAARELPFKL